jgi:hypothetical protein
MPRLLTRLLLYFSPLLPVFFGHDALAQTAEVLDDTIVNRAAVTSGRMQLLLMIEREQKKADAADGVHDHIIGFDDDLDKTALLTKAVYPMVNRTVAYIENNEKDDLVKRKYLGRVIENLKTFNFDMNDGLIDANYYTQLFESAYEVIRGLHTGKLQDYIRGHISRALYANSSLFQDNKAAMSLLMDGMADKYPDILIKKIHNLQNEVAADVIVAKAAPKNPKMILNFATSTAMERDIVRRNQDPYVRAIIRIADSCTTPLKGIFFIDEYFKGKISIAQINTITSEPEAYFRKMIEMRQEYFTSDLRKIYDRELTHEASRYVSTLNELHDASAEVRFRIVEKLNPIELYYIIVYGNDDLYTSSFLGCFNRLMARMKPLPGNQFLDSLGKDKFRTFLRLCANYNTLSVFLGSMKPGAQDTLMREFVTGLDRTLEGDLEGATDVANSFGSITDTALMKSITEQIRSIRDAEDSVTNRKGYTIYNILYTMLTFSSDSMSAELGIPPITVMPYNSLKDDSGTVVQQVFFYGDADGKGVFNSYVNGFGAPDWKVTREDKWVMIKSLRGKPVVIYANKPLDEPDDEMAQNALQAYLDSMEIHPSIIIHRGHSYHLPTTLEHINNRHKVVILGACGAYQNLSTVLSQSEDAHIVSTKQIGVGKINGPIIRAFNERLLAGKDVDWVDMWNQLSKQFSGGEMKQLFDDYVPPYKNMGALFLKAYRISGAGAE